MNTITEIEHAIRKLDDGVLAVLRAWFDGYLADAWDREIDVDAEAGRLDALADEALADLNAGRCQEL